MSRFIADDDIRRLNKYVGAAIEYWLKEKGVIVATLEKEGIISRKHLWEIREGRQGIKLLLLIRIALRLGIDPRDLIGNVVEIVFEGSFDDDMVVGLVETGEFRKPYDKDGTKKNSEDTSSIIG